MEAPLPDNEAERLEALRHYRILDTSDEQVFDDLATLTSQIFNAPITLIGLLDADRLWFKSKVGLTEAEMNPPVARLQTLFTTVRRFRSNVVANLE